MLRILIPLMAVLSAGASAESSIAVANAHIRLLPAMATNTSAYMVLKNRGGRDVALVGAKSPAAERMELQQVAGEGSLMGRRPVGEIAVRAGTETRLEPGSYQVVLIGLRRPLAPGDSVPMTLAFDDGSTQQVAAPVRAIQPAEHAR